MMAECSTSVDAVKTARKLWLSAASQSDLDEVERLYRLALSSKSISTEQHNDNSDGSKDCEEPKQKKIRTSSSGHCGLNRQQFQQAGEKLALLLCQSGRCKKARKGLESMGYICRLSKQVLEYPNEQDDSEGSSTTDETPPITKQRSSICQIVDGFLSEQELKRLRTVFESPKASYWIDHNYAVEPPSPYFSWVISLKAKSEDGFIGDLIQKILRCPLVNEKYPHLQSKANYVELWAHNRPHASGHQMHFDSDDEGRDGVRNPLISTILYITEKDATTNEKYEPVGGPSLVTNQKLTDIRLATKGWMAHPKPQRLVTFDGRYLHGVVPGKGVQTGRRVTLMIAFWEDIKARQSEGPGSARPFPKHNDNMPEWARQLATPLDEKYSNDYEDCKETDPIKLDSIYETLDGKKWKRGSGLPSYDEVFQGF